MKIPTRSEIYQQVMSGFQTALKERGESLPLSNRSVWAVLAGVLAQALSLVYTYGAWIYRQIFPQTQDEAALLLEGERFGEFPKAATQTKVKALASGQSGSIIASGLQASAQNVLFEVVNSYELDESGAIMIELVALELGALPAVRHLTFTRSVAGVENELEVVEWLSGSDAESIQAFRNRIISLRRNRPQGGSISDYMAWSMSVDGIAKVLIRQHQLGVVAVFPLVQLDGEHRLPSEEKRLQLERHLNQEDLAPLGVSDVIVGVFNELVADVEVTTLSPNNPTIKENITQAWQLYLWQRFPRQFQSQEDALEVISLTEMLSLAVSSGAKHIEMKLTVDGEVIEMQSLQYNQIVKLGAIQWN